MATCLTSSSTTIFLICFLSFFFNFSSARIPFQIYDIIDRANTNTFSVSENNPSDSDPIEKKPTTLIQWENEKTSSELSESESDPKTEPTTVDLTQSSNAADIPLTVFSFDPRNPRHPLPLPLRIRHRCHHYKPWKPRPREIVPQRNNDFRTRGRVRHMARGWTRFGHVDPMSHRYRGSMDVENSELLRRHNHQRRHEEDEYEPADKIKDTNLVKRIRKFLNQF